MILSSTFVHAQREANNKSAKVKCKTDFGVTLVLPRQSYSVQELEKGVTISWRIKVKSDLEGILAQPLDMGGASGPGESGFYSFASISGNDQYFGKRDLGLGPGASTTPHAIKKGNYEESLIWHGRNWTGPSDYGNPQGDAFPPGEYKFAVQIKGKVQVEDTLQDYDLKCEAPLLVRE